MWSTDLGDRLSSGLALTEELLLILPAQWQCGEPRFKRLQVQHGSRAALGQGIDQRRAALLSLSDDPRPTRIDLIEWKQPRTAGESYPHLYHTGIGRIALFAKNLDEEYQRLKAAGVDLVSEPVVIRFGNKAGAKFFCFKDPDGTFLELIEPYNG